MFQTKFVGKIKTRILSSITFFRKSCRLSDNVGKFDRARQAIDDNTIRRMHFVCWMNKGERTLEKQHYCNFQEILPDRAEHVELDCAAPTENCNATRRRLSNPAPRKLADIPKSCCIARWLSSFLCVTFFFFVPLARKVDEYTNFVFVQLTDHQPGLYDKGHPKGQSELGMGENFT